MLVQRPPSQFQRKTDPARVPGFGNRSAKIVVVGEAPATQEVKLGKPFMGKAGQLLNELLKDAGIHRDDVYCTNASLRPVGPDKKNHFFANPRKGIPSEVLIEGMTALGHDLNEINPNVVVPLGNYALWAMMQHQSIMNWRGSILWSDLWGRKVVPTIHPAALLRNSGEPGSTEQSGGMWKLRSVVVWDLIRAVEQSKFPELRRTKRTLVINPEGSLHDLCVQRLLNAKEIGVDIESWGGTRLACVGFSDGDPTWAVTWSYDNRPDRLALFKALLETPIPKYGQNLQYDATMLDQNGIHMLNVTFDTMIASHILYPEFPKGLDFLASIYTDIPYYKEEGKNWKESGDPDKRRIFYEYNAKDLCATTETKKKQIDELLEQRLWEPFQRKMRIFDACRWGTFNGMRADTALLKHFIEHTETERDLAQEELNRIAGYEVNPRSPKQVRKLVYEDRKLPERRKHGKVTTDYKALMDLVAKTGDRALSLVIIVRQKSKLLSNYYNESILSSDGRIRYSFNLAGTKFGRLSSSAPLWGPGLNVQNIPHEARRCFVADDGYELAEFDQMQAEAVITAYLANDPVHIDCFRHGKDVHRVTAALMMDMDASKWQEIPKKSQIRELAKRCNHGLNYGMQWATFMAIVNAEYDPSDPNSLHLTAAEAKRIHAKYLSIRPALHNYWEGIKRELKENGRTLVSPLGLPHTFLDLWSDTMLREGFSFKPQSTVGELTNIAIDRVYHDDEMRRMGVRFVTQVHDSIVLQWPKDNRKDVMSRVWSLLETELYINGYRVVVPWEGAAGPNWYKGDMEPLGVSRTCCEVGYEE